MKSEIAPYSNKVVIIIMIKSLRTKQHYRTRPPTPKYANFSLSCSSVSNCCGAIFSSTIYNYCKSEKNV